MSKDEWIQRAFEARERAYVPYSHFKVGACVALKNGQYIQGCNIENSAYGSTMCAERNAIYATYCQGYRQEDILGIAIVACSDMITPPCGACLQVLSELLHKDTPIILSNGKKEIEVTIHQLLPYRFTGDYLHV